MNAITETQAEWSAAHRAAPPAVAPYPQIAQLEAGAKAIAASGWGNAMNAGEMRALAAAIWLAMASAT